MKLPAAEQLRLMEGKFASWKKEHDGIMEKIHAFTTGSSGHSMELFHLFKGDFSPSFYSCDNIGEYLKRYFEDIIKVLREKIPRSRGNPEETGWYKSVVFNGGDIGRTIESYLKDCRDLKRKGDTPYSKTRGLLKDVEETRQKFFEKRRLRFGSVSGVKDTMGYKLFLRRLVRPNDVQNIKFDHVPTTTIDKYIDDIFTENPHISMELKQSRDLRALKHIHRNLLVNQWIDDDHAFVDMKISDWKKLPDHSRILENIPIDNFPERRWAREDKERDDKMTAIRDVYIEAFPLLYGKNFCKDSWTCFNEKYENHENEGKCAFVNPVTYVKVMKKLADGASHGDKIKMATMAYCLLSKRKKDYDPLAVEKNIFVDAVEIPSFVHDVPYFMEESKLSASFTKKYHPMNIQRYKESVNREKELVKRILDGKYRFFNESRVMNGPKHFVNFFAGTMGDGKSYLGNTTSRAILGFCNKGRRSRNPSLRIDDNGVKSNEKFPNSMIERIGLHEDMNEMEDPFHYREHVTSLVIEHDRRIGDQSQWILDGYDVDKTIQGFIDSFWKYFPEQSAINHLSNNVKKEFGRAIDIAVDYLASGNTEYKTSMKEAVLHTIRYGPGIELVEDKIAGIDDIDIANKLVNKIELHWIEKTENKNRLYYMVKEGSKAFKDQFLERVRRAASDRERYSVGFDGWSGRAMRHLLDEKHPGACDVAEYALRKGSYSHDEVRRDEESISKRVEKLCEDE